ncbi:hypothetical protein PoB_002293600 [Plakobranchus ocellatus]|uniref:Galectin n=1 Tax=Plakobranchus ocellatus TaxID=259542 RepID=A0AAV3ZPJ2_9GAST|nr:hypothetical protein PoB_002293600 [Plakobranchus ocellatus]
MIQGSLRGRGRNGNLSIDDTFYPPMSPQGTWTEGTSKKNKSQKLSVVNLFTPGNKVRLRFQHVSPSTDFASYCETSNPHTIFKSVLHCTSDKAFGDHQVVVLR